MDPKSEKPLVMAIGSVNIDYREDSNRIVGTHTLTDEQYFGGKAVNHAFQLSRLGAATQVYGCIGDDINGETLIGALNKLPNCTPHLQKKPGQMTGITVVSLLPRLRYFHISGANSCNITETCILPASSQWQKAECCIADLETNLVNVKMAFALGRDDLAVINILDASFPAKSVTEDILRNTDVIVVRRYDARFLVQDDTEYVDLATRIAEGDFNEFHDFAVSLLNKGPQCVILGLEDEGCLWALAKTPERALDGATIGKVPGIRGALSYPNSAHAAFAGCLAYQIARERIKERQEVRRAFLRRQNWGEHCRLATAAYVKAASKKGASEAMPSAEEIAAIKDAMQTGTRSIMSIDVQGSTARHGEANTLAWRRFRDELTDAVEGGLRAYQPKVVQWVGDGFWVVFDGAQNAVSAALRVSDKLSSAHPDLGCRIGINTGDVVIGVDNSAQGLPASLAKRTESNGRTGEVTITEWTKSLLNKNDFVFEERPTVVADKDHPGEPSFKIFAVRLKTKSP
jgi:sugar/nucleoside kinase (ribokinase family)